MLDYSNQGDWPNGFGQQQSPIELTTQNTHEQAGFLAYHVDNPLTLTLVHNEGTTIKILGEGNVTLFNRPFSFQQVHFHVPAEHVINGHQPALEVHLVHQNKIGQLAVLALFAEVGAQNPQFQTIVDHFDQRSKMPVSMTLNSWIPPHLTGYHYLGSLTTPPLTEGVEWLVADNAKLTLSQEQLNWWQRRFPIDNRDLQASNARHVEWYRG